nr:(deoxy)nucleoside triphosphate pyrophosphohydrolase [Paenibacillus humicola]
MIEVAAAIIANERGRLLIARRKRGKAQEGLWEFPGGKIELGETAADCLRRELLEEMNIRIDPVAYFAENEHRYVDAHIRLIAYTARYLGGTVTLSDHDDYRWAERSELREYAFAPADLKFVDMLQQQGEPR